MSADNSASSVSRARGVDRVRALQRVLYRCAKQDKDRRFHAVLLCDYRVTNTATVRAGTENVPDALA